MSTELGQAIADMSLQVRWKRLRRFMIPAIAVLAAAGAFAAWGPIGIGPGPIGNDFSSSTTGGLVSRTQPSVFVDPIDAGHSGAVIDSIAVLSTGSYPAPRILSVRGDGDQLCGGVWPLTGPQNFYNAGCAAGGLVPLFGRPVPASSSVDPTNFGPVVYPGIGAAFVAAPPGRAGCWLVTAVVIHYHAGIRHYTAVHDINLTACWSKAQLAAVQQQG